jgi:hypothetical protein
MHPEDLISVLDDSQAKCLSTSEIDATLRKCGPFLEEYKDKFPSVTLEWADSKLGYPHKLYVDIHKDTRSHGKFYVTHLFELDDPAFELVAKKLAEKTFVLFERDADRTRWRQLSRSSSN